ncbi:MAG: hydrogenobyrinic acid a,c-diamide synthase (glutamine-hydrolyzing)/cobyrinate a,c-diamide synthase [Oscillospiraceae bacterium]|nr:hydrogenobyrinic acid a,c-diamide synthase (glutamine-hydrolyzing)/cobyrinate a,c-diamide synthase [Oscillospiraceae bacterium]
MKASVPRVMLAAVQSGGGKTTVTCGLLRLLMRRGLRPAAFKCGPDYIDPLFHAQVIGTQTGNLDLFFTDDSTAVALLAEESAGCSLAVLEGVMGYYDGLGGVTDTASSYHLASVTHTPTVLIVDAKGTSLSLCAVISGFTGFRDDSMVQSVLLNRCTKAQYALLKPVIEAECGVSVLGYVPLDSRFALESRHLGLVTAAEVSNLKEKLDLLADTLSETVDLERLLALARSAPELEYAPLTIPPAVKSTPMIAVARDKAFCFYYRENLELLSKLGARLCFFSPLEDAHLPEGICGLYLGGGYPELYGKALEDNGTLRREIRDAVISGLPTFAECGGFLYLHESMTDQGGQSFPMCGVLPGACRYTGGLRRFGYITLTAEQDNLLCLTGDHIRAHEFHYFDSDSCGDSCYAEKPVSRAGWPCIHGTRTLFAGFPHLYFYSNPAFARQFVRTAEQYGGKDG